MPKQHGVDVLTNASKVTDTAVMEQFSEAA